MIQQQAREALDQPCGCVVASHANALLMQRDPLMHWPLQEEEELADEGQEQAALAQVDGSLCFICRLHLLLCSSSCTGTLGYQYACIPIADV